MDNIKIQETGRKIALLFDMIKNTVSKEELEDFNEYVRNADTIQPFIAPSEWIKKGGHNVAQMARERTDLLLSAIELTDKKIE